MEYKNNDRKRYDRLAEFEESAIPHLQDLFHAALRYTKNERDAEDLVQDTMMKGFTFFDRFQVGTNCRAWLLKILTNTFINQYRRRTKEREILGEENLSTVTHHFFQRNSTMSPENPERGMAVRTMSDEVQSALESLPLEFRSVVVLADLLGFPYKDVARVLDCPVGTVMSRLFRGRKQLRTLLADTAYDQGVIHDRSPYQDDSTNRTRLFRLNQGSLIKQLTAA